MKRFRTRRLSFLIGILIAVGYMAVLGVVSLQIDRRAYQDLHERAMQMTSLLWTLRPDSFKDVGSIPRIFPWQRMLLIDDARAILADTGWIQSSMLTSGSSGALFARRTVELAGLGHAPRTDEAILRELLRNSPESGRIGQLDARTIGAGIPVVQLGVTYGVVILVDKRDLIAKKHLDHVALLVSFLLVLLLLAILMLFVLLRLVSPLNRLARAVQALGVDIPQQRIELPGEARSDEIGLVSSTIAAALREARRGKDRIREFVDDVLHELKNPVSSLRSRLELSQMRGAAGGAVDNGVALTPGQIDRLVGDVRRIERLLAGLGALSTADSQDVAGISNPADLLRDLAGAYADLGRPITLANGLSGEETLPVDPETFSRLVRILVDNALDWSPPGERVTLSAAATPAVVTVRVGDRGPGVPPNLRDWVFRRFTTTRREDASHHAGLGLAIARSLVSRIRSGALCAAIRVEDNPGGGALFVLQVPRVQGA
jgi:signal transduction histidine kinase